MTFETMRVKNLGVSLRYPAYKRLQAGLVVFWLVLGLALIPYAGHSPWLLANGWWLGLAVAAGEAVEALVAVAVAKRRFLAQGAGD